MALKVFSTQALEHDLGFQDGCVHLAASSMILISQVVWNLDVWLPLARHSGGR